MIIKILGLMDLMLVLSLIIFKYGFIGQTIPLIFIVYLIIKGIIFFRDFTSIIDLVSTVIFVLALFGIFNVITWIALAWILQKAVFSLVSS